MGRTLEDMISSESPEVVQRAKALAEEQLVRLSVTKLLSNLGPGDARIQLRSATLAYAA